MFFTDPTLPNELITVNSLLTLSGASAATFVVCNGLQSVFNFNPKWLALLIALALAFFAAYLSTAGHVQDYVVAFFNGFLIYSTAAGFNAMSHKETKNGNQNGPSGVAPLSSPQRNFLSPWFKSN